MPKSYPQEFRDDVVAVALGRDSGVSLRDIATDFGVSLATLDNWIRKAQIASGQRPGVTVAESLKARELKKRVCLLEQENEVLRRAAAYLSQANLRLGGNPK